jgi:hypothetical protein
MNYKIKLMLCCSVQTFPRNEDDLDQDFTVIHNYKRRRRNIRSGTIIIDFKTRKLLIIQSYNKLWGLPKGHVEENETTQDCAIRETFEETGIQIDKSHLLKTYSIYNGDGIYYIVDGSNLEYNTKEIQGTQEITGIGWVCLKCLKQLINSNQISINCHLRTLLPMISNELLEVPNKYNSKPVKIIPDETLAIF